MYLLPSAGAVLSRRQRTRTLPPWMDTARTNPIMPISTPLYSMRGYAIRGNNHSRA